MGNTPQNPGNSGASANPIADAVEDVVGRIRPTETGIALRAATVDADTEVRVAPSLLANSPEAFVSQRTENGRLEGGLLSSDIGAQPLNSAGGANMFQHRAIDKHVDHVAHVGMRYEGEHEVEGQKYSVEMLAGVERGKERGVASVAVDTTEKVGDDVNLTYGGALSGFAGKNSEVRADAFVMASKPVELFYGGNLYGGAHATVTNHDQRGTVYGGVDLRLTKPGTNSLDITSGWSSNLEAVYSAAARNHKSSDGLSVEAGLYKDVNIQGQTMGRLGVGVQENVSDGDPPSVGIRVKMPLPEF